MENSKLFTLENFKNCNPDKDFNAFDYIHAIFKLAKLPNDLVCCLFKLLLPNFLLIDNEVFIEETYSEKYHQELLHEGKEAGYWVNLLELTGIFEDIDTEMALDIAQQLEESWNHRLNEKGLLKHGQAKVIHDIETDEVFLTIIRIPTSK